MKSILINVFLISNVFIAVACSCKENDVKQVSCSVCQCRNSEWFCNILPCFSAPPSGPHADKNFLTSLRKSIAQPRPVQPPGTVEPDEIGSDIIHFEENQNQHLLHVMQKPDDGIISENQDSRTKEQTTDANAASGSLTNPPLRPKEDQNYVQVQKKSSTSKVRARGTSKKSKNEINDDLDESGRKTRSLEQTNPLIKKPSYNDSKRKRSRKNKSPYKIIDENSVYYDVISDPSYSLLPQGEKPKKLKRNKEKLKKVQTFEAVNHLDERKWSDKNIFLSQILNQSRSKGKNYASETSFPSKKAIKKYLTGSHSIKQIHDDDSDEILRRKRSLNKTFELLPADDDIPLGYQENFDMSGDEYSSTQGLLGRREKRSSDSPVIYLSELFKNSRNNENPTMNRNLLLKWIENLSKRGCNASPDFPSNEEAQELTFPSNHVHHQCKPSRKPRSTDLMELNSEEMVVDELPSTRQKRDILKIIDGYVVMSLDPHENHKKHIFKIPAPDKAKRTIELDSESNEKFHTPQYLLNKRHNFNQFHVQIPYNYQNEETISHKYHHGRTQGEEPFHGHSRPYYEQIAAVNGIKAYKNIETDSNSASNRNEKQKNADSEDENSTPITPNDENSAHAEDRSVVEQSSTGKVDETFRARSNIIEDIFEESNPTNSEWEFVSTGDPNEIDAAVESLEKQEKVSRTEPNEADVEDLPENTYVVISGKDDEEPTGPIGTPQKPSISDIMGYLSSFPLSGAGTDQETKRQEIVSYLKKLSNKKIAN